VTWLVSGAPAATAGTMIGFLKVVASIQHSGLAMPCQASWPDVVGPWPIEGGFGVRRILQAVQSLTIGDLDGDRPFASRFTPEAGTGCGANFKMERAEV